VTRQLTMPDAAPQWSAVLARLGSSVASLTKHRATGWSPAGAYQAHAPGVPQRDARRGPYRCQRFARGEEELALWYVIGNAPLSHELVAATCGGVARVLGCEPDVVIAYVYEGKVRT
jgi:hypothetical protein